MDVNVSELVVFDYVILFIVFLSTFFAFFKGFVRSLLSFVNWLVSIVVTMMLNPHVLKAMETNFEDPYVPLVLSSAGVFIAVLVVMYIISYQLAQVFYYIGFSGIIDRSLGMAFGIVRGVLIGCIIFYASVNVYSIFSKHQLGEDKGEQPDQLSQSQTEMPEEVKQGPDWLTEAKTYNALKMTTNYILAYLPANLKTQLESSLHGLSGDFPELGFSDSIEGEVPKTLSAEQKQSMAKIISSLPEDKVSDIVNHYGGDIRNISELEKMAIYREILAAFLEARKNEELSQNLDVEESVIDSLLLSLSAMQEKGDKNKEKGYRQRDIQQIERLINTIE